MSKIASKPIELSSDVKFNIVDNLVSVEGPKGKLEFTKTPDINIEQTDNKFKLNCNERNNKSATF